MAIKVKAGDQAMINGVRIEVIEPYKVNDYWVVRTLPRTKTKVMSSGTIVMFRVKPILDTFNQ